MLAPGLNEPAPSSVTVAKTMSSFRGDTLGKAASLKNKPAADSKEKKADPAAPASGSYNRQPVQVPGATVTRREINVPGFLRK